MNDRIEQIRARVEKALEKAKAPGGSSMRESEVDCIVLLAEYEKLIHIIKHCENALEDYVERLEKQGGIMGYGRDVLRMAREALSAPVAGEGRK